MNKKEKYIGIQSSQEEWDLYLFQNNLFKEMVLTPPKTK